MQNKTLNNTLILITSGYPFKGIAEPYLLDEIKFLSEKFKRIFVVPVTDKYDRPLLETPGNVEIITVDVRRAGIVKTVSAAKIIWEDLMSLMKLPGAIKNVRYYFAYLKSKVAFTKEVELALDIKRRASEQNIVVYSYWMSEPALVASLIKKDFPGVKAISRGHGYDIFEEQSKYGFIPFKKFKLKYLDKIYSVSKRGEKYLEKQFPDQTGKIKTAYLGTEDCRESAFDENKGFSIATCSIIRGIKRLELMVDILKHITFGITWHVLGDGPDLEALKRKSKGLPSNVKIHFHGFLSATEIKNFYRSTQVNLFLSLSSSEGLPVSMMEAVSFGIPLMSTDVGGCKEICNEETGTLILKDFDPEKVAEQITEFKNSKKNTIQFRRDVRKFWEENFNAGVNYKKFAQEISEL